MDSAFILFKINQNITFWSSSKFCICLPVMPEKNSTHLWNTSPFPHFYAFWKQDIQSSPKDFSYLLLVLIMTKYAACIKLGRKKREHYGPNPIQFSNNSEGTKQPCGKRNILLPWGGFLTHLHQCKKLDRIGPFIRSPAILPSVNTVPAR